MKHEADTLEKHIIIIIIIIIIAAAAVNVSIYQVYFTYIQYHFTDS